MRGRPPAAVRRQPRRPAPIPAAAPPANTAHREAACARDTIPSVLSRPPLPPGPYLVVGLARSGVAAALALRALGAEVVGLDSGAVPDARRTELEAAGVAVHTGTPGTELLAGVGDSSSRAPACPGQAPVARRGARGRGSA